MDAKEINKYVICWVVGDRRKIKLSKGHRARRKCFMQVAREGPSDRPEGGEGASV